LNVIHRIIEPTRIAATEKSIIGILRVPGAFKSSNPIPPPITSNKAPRNIPIPFFIIAKKSFTALLLIDPDTPTPYKIMEKKGMREKAKAGNDRIGTIDKKSQTSFGIRLYTEFLVPQVPERFERAGTQFPETGLKQVLWKRGSGRGRPKSLM